MKPIEMPMVAKVSAVVVARPQQIIDKSVVVSKKSANDENMPASAMFSANHQSGDHSVKTTLLVPDIDDDCDDADDPYAELEFYLENVKVNKYLFILFSQVCLLIFNVA